MALSCNSNKYGNKISRANVQYFYETTKQFKGTIRMTLAFRRNWYNKMILQVYLNGCHIGDYANPTFVGLKLYASSKKSEHFVCINNNKIAIFNYKNTECEIDAFCCQVNDLANKDMQKHYDWAKLELWNDMYTKKLKWKLSYSAYKENKSFIRRILDSL